MNNVFLSEITKAYLNDTNTPSDNYNELYEYIIEVRNSIRIHNHTLYEDLLKETTLYQQKIIYRLFDTHLNSNLTEITEDFGAISGPVIGGLLVAVGTILGLYGDVALGHAYKSFLDSMAFLKNRFLNISSVKKLGEQIKQHEVIMSMLDEEFSNCARRCGIDPKEKTTFWHKLKSGPFKYTNMNTLDGGDCAISCTLDYLTSSFAELNKVYKDCLYKTGEDLSTADMTSDPLKSMPTGAGCQEIRDELDDSYKNFKKMIDILFKDSPQVKSLWVNIMNQKVKDALAGKSVKHYSPRNVKFDLKGQYINSEFR